MNTLKIISRDEMRKINAGLSEGGCINCITPGGEECWYRSDTSDPESTCESIYPGYDPDEVYGSLVECDGCIMQH